MNRITEIGDTAHLKGSIDRIICDPPFLSEDCQTKGTPSAAPRLSLQGAAILDTDTHNSRTHSPLALQTAEQRRRPGSQPATGRLHRRAHGVPHHEAVPVLWAADDRLLAGTRTGAQQRVLLLREL